MQYVTFQCGEYFTLLQGRYSTCFIYWRTMEIQCHVYELFIVCWAACDLFSREVFYNTFIEIVLQ